MRGLLCFLFWLCAAPLYAQPVPCADSDGKRLADCVEAAYPDKLAAGVSLETRKANLAFLRDRLIETARCAKIDAGLNCKRGNCQNLSLDFIAVKQGGVTFGVDFAGHSDDVSRTLDLGWYVNGPPTYGYPTYKAYGPVSCVIDPPTPPVDPPAPNPDMERLKTQVATLEKIAVELRAALEMAAGAITVQGDRLTGVETVLKAELPAIHSRVFKLEQMPVPQSYSCRVQFGLRCTVTADVNP